MKPVHGKDSVGIYVISPGEEGEHISVVDAHRKKVYLSKRPGKGQYTVEIFLGSVAEHRWFVMLSQGMTFPYGDKNSCSKRNSCSEQKDFLPLYCISTSNASDDNVNFELHWCPFQPDYKPTYIAQYKDIDLKVNRVIKTLNKTLKTLQSSGENRAFRSQGMYSVVMNSLKSAKELGTAPRW